MEQALQEFVDSRGQQLQADAGVLRGVKLLGLTSRNGRRYLPEALSAAASLYEGAKVNINHSKLGPLAPRDYQDRLGTVCNVQLRADEGLFADLQFNPKHPVAEQLLWDAQHAPHNVGFSHNVLAKTRQEGDQTVVEAIVGVQSVDLVADPATTRGLFESATPVANPATDEARLTPALLASLTSELLLLTRPDLVEQLTAPLVARLRALEVGPPISSREQAPLDFLPPRTVDTAAFVQAIT
jgi:hypothetical protein